MTKCLVLTKNETKELKENGQVVVFRRGLNYLVKNDGTIKACPPEDFVIVSQDKSIVVLTGEQTKELKSTGKVKFKKNGVWYEVAGKINMGMVDFEEIRVCDESNYTMFLRFDER